ncbi:MAG: transcriptional repressor [Planctomycetota bacterium]|nr:transcriptional repressor [Planctomycetota bacterium]
MERKTVQRQAIREAIEEASRPLSPQEVLDLARARVKRIGIATVYRTIKSLLAEGVLKAVDLPGEPPRYEPAGKHHHHHFRCRTCNKVYEIEGCPKDLKRMAPRGFRVEGHDLVLYGLCAGCA